MKISAVLKRCPSSSPAPGVMKPLSQLWPDNPYRCILLKYSNLNDFKRGYQKWHQVPGSTMLAKHCQYLRIVQLNMSASALEWREVTLQGLWKPTPPPRFSCRLRRNQTLPLLHFQAAAFASDTPGYDFYQRSAAAVPPAGSFHFLFLKSMKSGAYVAYNLPCIFNNKIHSAAYQSVILCGRCFAP